MDLLRLVIDSAPHRADHGHQRADDQGHARSASPRPPACSRRSTRRSPRSSSTSSCSRSIARSCWNTVCSSPSPGSPGHQRVGQHQHRSDRDADPAGPAQPDAVRHSAGGPAGALLPAAQDRHEHAHAGEPAAPNVGRLARTARFGDKVPVPVTQFAPIATGGTPQQPITSFQYETIGVNIDITPRTHHNDDVSLALKIARDEHLRHRASAGCRRSAIARSTPPSGCATAKPTCWRA